MIITNKFQLPEPLVKAIENDGYSVPKGAISVTSLVDSPLLRRLKEKHEHEVEVDAVDQIWLLLGKSVHYMLEKAGSGYMVEERRQIIRDGQIISGQIDLYDPVTQILWDYKITSVWTAIYNPDGKKEYECQGNLNAHILREHGFKVKAIKNLLILRDWSYLEYIKSKHSYPAKSTVVIDLSLWSADVVEGYIRNRLFAHQKEGQLCTDQERWKQPTVFQVKKPGSERAYRNFATMEEAEKFMEEMTKKNDYIINVKVGSYNRCENYCDYRKFCPLYKEENNDL